MKTFLLIDTSNLFFRTRYAARGDQWTKLGLSMHLLFNSIKSVYKKYKADHIVFIYEGRSWRKDFDETYKYNRLVKRQAMTEAEQEEDKLYMAAFADLQSFIKEKTNCTVLQNPVCEADDLISQWIQDHPNDFNIILSGDSDFYQLLADNVMIVDGVNKKVVKITGVFDEYDKPILNKKTKKPEIVNPEYALFLKIVRGDPGDNVSPAYLGVREKKIQEVFNDRHNKGYVYNNFMLSRWVDHNQKERLVKECIEHNKILIDLKAQPEIVKKTMKETITNAYKQCKDIQHIGFAFMKFCGKYELVSLSESANDLVEIFKKKLV